MVDIASDPNGAARSASGPLLRAGHTSPTNDDQRPGRESVAASATTAEPRSAAAARYLLAGIRLALGWVFLWAFLDKTFGLGFATPRRGPGSTAAAPPRASSVGAEGPFTGFYHAIAGTGRPTCCSWPPCSPSASR